VRLPGRVHRGGPRQERRTQLSEAVVDRAKMERRSVGWGLVSLLWASACSPWREEVIIHLRDPSLVSVVPPSGNARDGAIPPGRAPAVMKVVDGSKVRLERGVAMSVWLVRQSDGAISSFASYYPQTLTGPGAIGTEKQFETALLSSAGDLRLLPADAPTYRLADLRREPGSVALFPARVGYTESWADTTTSTTNGVTTTTVRSMFTFVGDRVVLATPASNVDHGTLYCRPSRASGVIWMITGLVFDGLALYVLEKGRSAREKGQISENAMPVLYGTAGALAAASVPFHAYGLYLLLIPEKRTPLP